MLDKDNQNINAVFASLIVKNKDTDEVLKVFPYRLYEFSDMTFPHNFPKTGGYIISLQAMINGDRIYSERPLTVDFDLLVGSGDVALVFEQLLIYYLIPTSLIMAGIVTYLRIKRKI